MAIKPVFKIGAHDYSQWVSNGGLALTDEDLDSSASGRSTLDGQMVRNRIASKNKWTVTMLDIPADVAAQLFKDLKQVFFSATLLDPESGRHLTKTYYCASRPFGVQRYDPGSGKLTYSGVTFNITEQ